MEYSTDELQLHSYNPNVDFKPPKLAELYEDTFGFSPTGLHNSRRDVELTS